MIHQKLKDFWIKKINDLIVAFSFDLNLLDEGSDWVEKINKLEKWSEIDNFGKNLFKDVHVKAGKVVPTNYFTPTEKHGEILVECFTDLDSQFIDLANVFKTKIGVDPTDDTLATGADGNTILVDGHTIPKWKHIINKKLPDGKVKLTDIPAEKDLTDLLYNHGLFQEIADDFPELITKGLTGSDRIGKFGYDWYYKVNKTALQEYKNAKTTIAKAETHLGLNPGDLATITTNATYNTNGKTLAQLLTPHTCPPCPQTHCPTAHADYDVNKIKSAEYQRIHTKLNGKVSDSELDNLLKRVPAPKCSHTDYDTIKQALAKEKEKLTKKEASCELEKKEALAEKEKEIIEKIITDLELSTERERDLEAVITEIKSKLTPPACDKCPGKDSKITELQEQITKLQTPKTLKDLPISEGIKKEVIKISQDLGLTAQSCARLESATSYQELSSLQKKAFQEKLKSEIRERDEAISLNWGLGFLTLSSLLLLAWMIFRESKKRLRKLDEVKED